MSAGPTSPPNLQPGRFRHIAYFEAGTTNAPALVLLHGGTMTATWNWTQALPALSSGYHVIAPDSAGHGDSANPRTVLRYEDMADDVLELLEALGIGRAAFYGFSDGAQIALEIAIRAPTFPSALVLSAVLHELTDGYRAEVRRFFGDERFQANAFVAAHPGLAAECDARHRDWGMLAPQVWELWNRAPQLSAERLARVVAPTLLLTGDRDPFIRLESTVALLRMLPGAELAVIPAAAHDYDERFTAVARSFLARHA
jgi:pimeloyl-ACP methyl ester carboxylesterase